MKTLIDKIYGLGRKGSAPIRIEIKEVKFDIFQLEKIIASVPWLAITKISAFKRDLGTTDLLCFEIEVTNDDRVEFYEINEEMYGFEKLVNQFEKKIDLKINWRELVIKPAFASQRMVLWEIGRDVGQN